MSSHRRDLLWMLGPLALFLLWSIPYGEIIQLGDGLGVDGIEYARIVREAPEVLDHGLGPLYAARVVPSLLVRLGMEATGMSLDTPGILLAFKVYNAWMSLASVVLWWCIARTLALSASGRWLGYLVVVVNCAQLETHPYYPVFTDPTALTLSLLLVYAHLSGRLAWVFVVTAVGAFTWPTLLYLGLALFLFPHRREPVEAAPNAWWPRGMGLLAAAGVTAALGYGAVSGYRQGLTGEWAEPGLGGYALLATGCGLVALYALVTGWALSNQRRFFTEPWTFLSKGFGWRLALGAGLYLAVDFLSGRFLDPSQTLQGSFLVGSTMRAAQRPLVFYVMHLCYFGPVIVLALYRWRRMIQLLHSHGFGLTLYGALSALLLIQPLSRQSLTVLPLLAVLLALTFEPSPLSRRELWGWGALSLLMSRIWMPVNALQARWPVDDDPIFWFRINYGKYFSDLVFWPQLVFAMLLTAGLWLYLRRRDQSPVGSDELPEAAQVTLAPMLAAEPRHSEA